MNRKKLLRSRFIKNGTMTVSSNKKEYAVSRILRLRRDTSYHFPFRRSAILAEHFYRIGKTFLYDKKIAASCDDYLSIINAELFIQHFLLKFFRSHSCLCRHIFHIQKSFLHKVNQSYANHSFLIELLFDF